MLNADFFLTLAQISVNFAGFAGVVNTLGRSNLNPKARSFRVRSLIGWSLFAFFFSMLPFFVGQFGLLEPQVWRVCCFVLAVGQTSGSILVWRQLIPLYQEALLDSKHIAIFITVVSVVIVIASFAASFSVFPGLESSIYLSGVLWALAQACYLFVRLVLFVQPSEV